MIEHFQVKEDLLGSGWSCLSLDATWAAPCNGVVPSKSGLIKHFFVETLEVYICLNWGPTLQCILKGRILCPGFFYIFV